MDKCAAIGITYKTEKTFDLLKTKSLQDMAPSKAIQPITKQISDVGGWRNIKCHMHNSPNYFCQTARGQTNGVLFLLSLLLVYKV